MSSTVQLTLEGNIHYNAKCSYCGKPFDKSNLPKDNYKYSEDILSLIGKHHRYSIGDKVEIKVKSANKETRNIDFAVAKEYVKDEKEEEIKPKTRVKTR